MKLLFLGGTSYLGQKLIEELLLDKKFEISVYTRSPESEAKISHLKVEKVSDLSKLPKQDVVLNLITDYGKGKDFNTLLSINFELPLKLLSVIECDTVINFSTALDKTVSNYSYSKKKLEEELIELSNKINVQVINLHIQQFYGPDLPRTNFVGFLLEKLRKNEDIPLTDCLQRRDFIYITDLVQASKTILENLSRLNKVDSIEIGSGVALELREFVLTAHRLTHSKSNLLFGSVQKRSNEPLELVANVNRLKSMGWSPKLSYLEGLKTILTGFQL